jgi:hypothetical protein
MTQALARHKRLPSLQSLLAGKAERPARQSVEEMNAVLHAFAMTHGLKFTKGTRKH